VSGFLFLFLFTCIRPLSAQSEALFDDSRVSAIFIELPADSFDYLISNLVNEHYFKARFIFDDGQTRDTVEDAGLRLRGNTSLYAQKKSFKISFNEFVPDRKYQGVKKLNLRGQHNDPTMVREKLFYEVWNKAGMPERRAAFVKVFINQQYRGLYTNMEEIDKTWLGRVYDDNDGNLYKCTWPADLDYHGPVQLPYKTILNNPDTRAYDLTTNELSDDYSRLVALITALYQPVNAGFPDQINQILNVDGVLKAFALDVATGNWDDYFYNKNNYYLYDNPSTGRFEFITFDTDNTFGVDWLGKDWATRNCLAWQKGNEPRPLATKLLAVPAFKAKYVRYLDTLTRLLLLPDSIFPRIDALRDLIAPAAATDLFRSLDYGYDMADFENGFEQTVDGHTPYGIKPFLGIRGDSIRSQIAGLLTETKAPEAPPFVFEVYPNPAAEQIFVQCAPELFSEHIRGAAFEASGRLVGGWDWEAGKGPFAISIGDLPAGLYVLSLSTDRWNKRVVFLKGTEMGK